MQAITTFTILAIKQKQFHQHYNKMIVFVIICPIIIYNIQYLQSIIYREPFVKHVTHEVQYCAA